MKTVVTTAILALLALSVQSAEASRYDSRPYSHFASKACSTERCFSNHPSGRYVFPYHYGHRRD